MTDRGLYVHVPFCARKCHYCNYVIRAAAPQSDRGRYLEALELEAARAAERYPGRRYDTLYLGGGTPSALSAAEMARLFEIVRTRFDVAPDAEITCEANPGDASEEKLSAYRALGINRVSLGAQSFDDALLADMGRAHDARAIRETLDALSRAGIANVSLDLILRLPGQTQAQAEESLALAAASGAGQIVIYDLNVHDNTVYGARRRAGKLNVPGEEAHESMALAAERILTAAGFRQYEVSSFARPGFESRHNLIYWRNGEYLGLGPGAFSYMDGCRYQTAPSVARWFEKAASGDFVPDEEDRPTPEQRESESLLTGLRLSEGFDFERLRIIRESAESEARRLALDGLLEIRGTRAALTPRGRRLAETVFTRLSL